MQLIPHGTSSDYKRCFPTERCIKYKTKTVPKNKVPDIQTLYKKHLLKKNTHITETFHTL